MYPSDSRKRQYVSGAEKRKEKQHKIEAAVAISKKIDTFLIKSKSDESIETQLTQSDDSSTFSSELEAAAAATVVQEPTPSTSKQSLNVAEVEYVDDPMPQPVK